jgi:hypothetical protein
MSQPPAPDPKQSLDRINAALAAALPGGLDGDQLARLPLLAGLLDDLARGRMGADEVRHTLAADPSLAELLRALAGREIAAGGVQVSFGAGAQTGDFSMRDLAGRDLVNLALHQGDVYNFYNAQVSLGGPGPAVASEGSAPPGSARPALAPNPFGRRGRIDDPAEFFDREHLLERIFVELAKGTNLSLVGESEIGKSSLLTMICHHAPARLGLPPGQVVSLNMQLVRDEHDFFESLCELLQVPSSRGFALGRRLAGRRYLLCLDEIEKMRKECFSGDEREELRGLADGSQAPLTLVTASRVPLADLFPDKWGNTSPLDNICTMIEVPPFSAEKARQFVQARLVGTGVAFPPDEVGRLVRESGGRPALLQRAAAALYDRLTLSGD